MAQRCMVNNSSYDILYMGQLLSSSPIFEQPIGLATVCTIANDGHGMSQVDRGAVWLIKHTTLVEL